MRITAYEYLFYRYYRLSQSINPKQYDHAFYACLYMSLSFGLNLFALLILYMALNGNVGSRQHESPWFLLFFLFIFISLLPVQLLYFRHKERYKGVVKAFAMKSSQTDDKGSAAFRYYLIASFLLLPASLGLAIHTGH